MNSCCQGFIPFCWISETKLQGAAHVEPSIETVFAKFLFQGMAHGIFGARDLPLYSRQSISFAEMVTAELFKQKMEVRAMVRMLQMAKLMQHHIIPEMLGDQHQSEIEIDIPPGRTAAPVGTVVLDCDP